MHFSKTGKMPSLALGNSNLSVKKPPDSGVVYCGVWTLCQKECMNGIGFCHMH